MNEKIVGIMNKTKCPVCKGLVERDVHVPRFGQGKSVIAWRCKDDDCAESKHWHKGNRHLKSAE